MFEKLYTTGEVAKIFGVPYVAVKKWAYSGKIRYIKTPGKRAPKSERRSGEAETKTCRVHQEQGVRNCFFLS